MGFFKDAIEQSPARNIARMHAWIWALIYGGLMLMVLGFASRPYDVMLGWVMMVLGGLMAAAGFVLIWVRSRMT